VEFVDHDDIERVGLDAVDSPLKRLDHREQMAARRAPTLRKKLTEVAPPQNGPVRRQGLPQDLLAMRNEQQRQSAVVPFEELAVVERGDNGLARSGRRHHKIEAAIMPLSLDHQSIRC
jgi:hypothetical protein